MEYENEKLIDSVKKSSFESMKKDELRNQDKIRVLKKSNKEMPFVRKGEINEWKKYYSDKNLEKINLKFGNTMKLLGYEL